MGGDGAGLLETRCTWVGADLGELALGGARRLCAFCAATRRRSNRRRREEDGARGSA
jgi:hypothetical protein